MAPKDAVRSRMGRFFSRAGVGAGSSVVSLLGTSDAERELYAALGVYPGDIEIIERDPLVRGKILAKEWGTRLFAGSLKEFAAEAIRRGPRFAIDAVNADFLGSVWDHQDELAALFPAICRSSARCLAITSLARRDPAFVGVGRFAADQMRALVGPRLARGLIARLLAEYDEVFPASVRSVFRIEREVAFLWWLAITLESPRFGGARFAPAAFDRMAYCSTVSSSLHSWFVRFEPAPRGWNIGKALRRLIELTDSGGLFYAA